MENVRKILYQKLVYVNVLNSYLETPLHLACSLGLTNIVILLLSFGADPLIEDSASSTAFERCTRTKDLIELMNKMLYEKYLWIDGPHLTNGDTPLHSAIRRGEIDTAQKFIKQENMDVNQLNSSYETPLHLACALGNESAVHLLVLNGADMYKRDLYNNTPIHRAVAQGHVEIMNLLILAFGCDAKTTGYQGRSLLHFACAIGNTKLVTLIIENHGISPYATDGMKHTPLHIAASNNHKEIASLIIVKYKCGVDCKSKYNHTPLHLACYRGHTGIVSTLICEHKADISARNHLGFTPLQVAALGGHSDIVEMLITRYFCSPQVKGSNGKSLLHCACRSGCTDLAVRLITHYNLDPGSADFNGYTPLHVACFHGHEELARLLISKFNCFVECENKHNFTPLHVACYRGHRQIANMLLNEFDADKYARNYQNSTPLHLAALEGHADMVQTLINEFHFDPHDKGFQNRTLLHYACDKGHTKLAVMLVREFKLDPCLADDNGETPLHIACLCGHEELAKLFVTRFNCSIDLKNKINMTPLYMACANGHINVVKMFVNEFLGDIREKPLFVAIKSRNAKIVHDLATMCDPQDINIGYESRPLLHQVILGGGSASMLQKLISIYGHDPASIDDDNCNNTLLHTAAGCGEEYVVDLLLREYSSYCPVDCTNAQGQTPLHCACIGGHAGVVKVLLSHNASVYIRDANGDTPLKKAYQFKEDGVSYDYQMNGVLYGIFDAFGISSESIDYKLFHQVCTTGTVKFMEILLSDFGVDLSTLIDKNGNSLIHTAVECGRSDMATLLFETSMLHVDYVNFNGQTPLHAICSRAPALSIERLLHLFITKYEANAMLEDNAGNQPIHLAAQAGRTEVITELILRYGCDANARGFKHRTILHEALSNGFTSTGTTLIDIFHISVHCTDDDGNTPLHISCLYNQPKSVELLLYSYHVPIFVRNKGGKTALELVTGDDSIRKLFKQYMHSEYKSIQAEYEVLRSLSLRKYPGQQKITRIFVLGNAESGKRTLIESLKRRGLILYSLLPVSVAESEVPRHTAGIVPSLFDTEQGGRFLYYDFAGDKEYFSSHSAILEIVSQSSVGTSVFVIVAKLTKDLITLRSEIGYWLSFVSYNVRVVDDTHKLGAIVVLSHSDCLSSVESSRKSKSIKQYLVQSGEGQLNNCYTNLNIIDVVSSNCRKPRSSKNIEDTLQQFSESTQPCTLSCESMLLHGLLEKDFKHVVACKLKEILYHIESTRCLLPTTAMLLYPKLKELRDVGLLMMIGKSDENIENHLIVLKPCTLTNEVHQNLFSKAAVERFSSSISSQYANMGIIPEQCLYDFLPEHITKECLLQLQYCQEFSHTEVGLDYSVTRDNTSNENLLYFPALCSLESSKCSSWPQDPNRGFSIGWYAKCTKDFDYFPPRFLHVVLLRLAFTLALPIATCNVSNSSLAQAYSRRCTMWKNGIQWLMEEGVECIFEIVDDNKGIIAIIKVKENCKTWATILGKIINTAMLAKFEFCHAVSIYHFLLKSDNPASFQDSNKLFDVNDVQRVIREGKQYVLSVDGKELLDSSYLAVLKQHTYWGMQINIVMLLHTNIP